tara:strand:- start:275 stop:577 length:303 start_codon:yes stop_codon:yes gene_type:complete
MSTAFTVILELSLLNYDIIRITIRTVCRCTAVQFWLSEDFSNVRLFNDHEWDRPAPSTVRGNGALGEAHTSVDRGHGTVVEVPDPLQLSARGGADAAREG